MIYVSGESYTAHATAAQSVDTSTTLVDSTYLSVPVKQGGRYKVEAWIPFILSGVLSGYKFRLHGPVGSAGAFTSEVINTTTDAFADVDFDPYEEITAAGALANAGTHLARFMGYIVPNAAGVVKVQFAQNVSDVDAIAIPVGAWLTLTP